MGDPTKPSRRIPLHSHTNPNNGGVIGGTSIFGSAGGGTGAVPGAVDHGDLVGLGDDDHSHYATNVEFDDHSARHDAGGADVMAIDAAAATGSLRTLGTGAAQAAAGSHTHAGSLGPILITDTPAGTPLVFADLLQNEAGTDLLYADA